MLSRPRLKSLYLAVELLIVLVLNTGLLWDGVAFLDFFLLFLLLVDHFLGNFDVSKVLYQIHLVLEVIIGPNDEVAHPLATIVVRNA